MLFVIDGDVVLLLLVIPTLISGLLNDQRIHFLGILLWLAVLLLLLKWGTHSWSKSAETWISQWDCEHGIVALWNKSQFILVMLCLLIFSLEDWLWLLRLSKEPKIVMAKRIISEWQTWLGLYWKVNDFGRQWCGANPYPLWGHCRTCRYFLGCTVLPRTGFPSAIPGSTTRSKRCRKSMTTCRR